MRNKIALIMPYFGQWPPWIGLYLKSCSINSFIDFHFFTDCGNPKQVYKNTFFHKISFLFLTTQIQHSRSANKGPVSKMICQMDSER